MIVTEIQVDIIPYWEIKIIFSFIYIMYCLANVNNRIIMIIIIMAQKRLLGLIWAPKEV